MTLKFADRLSPVHLFLQSDLQRQLLLLQVSQFLAQLLADPQQNRILLLQLLEQLPLRLVLHCHGAIPPFRGLPINLKRPVFPRHLLAGVGDAELGEQFLPLRLVHVAGKYALGDVLVLLELVKVGEGGVRVLGDAVSLGSLVDELLGVLDVRADPGRNRGRGSQLA